MTTTTASRGAARSSVTGRGEAKVARGGGSIGMLVWCGCEQGSEGGWSKIEDFLEIVVMMWEVIVSALRKEVVQPALKIAVRRRSPWPKEKSQKRAMHSLRPKRACVM
jgi:hypothetical protein